MSLFSQGATVVVIEHDPRRHPANADYLLTWVPGGGAEGGTIVTCGTPGEVAQCKESKNRKVHLKKEQSSFHEVLMALGELLFRKEKGSKARPDSCVKMY